MHNKKRDSRFGFVSKTNIMSKSKRSQSEIITTVLIILLVLAAIVIVWQVVRSTVTTGADQITGGTDCITLDLELVDVTISAVDTKFKVKRGAGVGDLDKIVVIIDGTLQTAEITANTLKELETTSEQTYNVVAAKEIEIAARLGANSNNKLCGPADTYTVA